MKVIVIGGGIMGLATALELRARGAAVTLLERAVVGAEASSAAGGILGAQMEAHVGPDLLDFVRARDAYPNFARDLEERTGVHVGYRRCGIVKLVDDVPAARALLDAQLALGLRAELLLDAAVREAEPEISPERRAALFFPDDAQIDPRALLRALSAACARAGVEVRVGALVTGLLLEGEVCRGVSLGAESLAADAVVLAAGSWASLVPGVPLSLPKVTPARGQIVALEERPPRTRRIVFHATGYVVPRGDGRVLCGSTLEHVGYTKDVTAKGVVDILGAACAAVPSLGTASVSDFWSNFRPYVAEGGPLVGPSPVPGLFLATGHYRNGILLAHDTALRVASAVLGG
ncbi:MAG TPA: glycine oxidase ThiO [Polyangiaceae bacterium]|nr:glycine oxidase ThiO [Polyangiaceae bacterium]